MQIIVKASVKEAADLDIYYQLYFVNYGVVYQLPPSSSLPYSSLLHLTKLLAVACTQMYNWDFRSSSFKYSQRKMWGRWSALNAVEPRIGITLEVHI